MFVNPNNVPFYREVLDVIAEMNEDQQRDMAEIKRNAEERIREEMVRWAEENRQREEAFQRRQAAEVVLNEPAIAPNPPAEQISEELLEKNLKIPFSYKDFEVEMVRNQSRVQPKTVLECIGKNITTIEWNIHCHSEKQGHYAKKKKVHITNLKDHFAHCEGICKQHKVSRIDLTFRNAANKVVQYYRWN